MQVLSAAGNPFDSARMFHAIGHAGTTALNLGVAVLLLAAHALGNPHISLAETGRIKASAPAQVRGTLIPIGQQSLGDLEVTVFAANDTSSTVTSDSTFSVSVNVSVDTLRVLVDAPSSTNRTFHPALFRAPIAELRSGITVLMVPLQWTITKGTYAGETIPISMHEALSTPKPRFGHYLGGGLYQGTYFTDLEAWRPGDRPVPVAVYNETPGYQRFTAQDSIDLWKHLEDIEKTFGRNLFRSATTEEVGWTDDDQYSDVPDGVLGIRVDTSTCGRGGAARGDLIWSWPSRPAEQWESPPQPSLSTRPWQSTSPDAFRLSGWAIAWGSTNYCHDQFDQTGGIPSALVKHETGHAFGFGHACRIPSIMMGYNCNPDSFHWLGTGSFSQIDVAFWELKQRMFKLAEEHETRFGFLPALFGERALLRGLRPVPSKEEWENVVFKASKPSGSVDFGDTGVEVDFSDINFNEEAVVWVGAYNEPPVSPIGITKKNVGQDRVVIEKRSVPDSDFDFGPNAEVRFDIDKLSGSGNPSNVTIYRRPARATSPFQKLSTRYDSGTNQLVVTTDRFGEFAFASDTEPLPVELASFDASQSGESGVELRWTTASETNSAGFHVQHRASDEESWSKLGYVESKASGGTTTETHTYRFDAENLAVGRHEFRLKQMDLDGTPYFHDPVNVEVQMQEAIKLTPPAPNPVSSTATLSFAVREADRATVAVYDLLGRKAATLFEGHSTPGESTRLRLDASGLPSGSYIIRLQADGQTRIQRMTVVR